MVRSPARLPHTRARTHAHISFVLKQYFFFRKHTQGLFPLTIPTHIQPPATRARMTIQKGLWMKCISWGVQAVKARCLNLKMQRGGWTLTYPGIPAVQDLIGGSPGGTAGHTRVQPVANFSAVAAVKQHFSLPFLQPLGQASVVTSSSPGANFSPLAEFGVPTFPHADRDGQDEHKLQMLHSKKKKLKSQN